MRGKGMKKWRNNSDNAGFTLVELIIAIAIMAVLAGAIGLTVIRYIRSQSIKCDGGTSDDCLGG